MPVLYFDTSALAKRYYREEGHERVKRLVGIPTNEIVLSNIGAVEMASVLRKKYREGDLSERNARLRLSRFIYDSCQDYKLCSVTPSLLGNAIGLISKHDLRSLDAIHLATARMFQAQNQNFQFITSDGNLYDAANAERMQPIDPTD